MGVMVLGYDDTLVEMEAIEAVRTSGRREQFVARIRVVARALAGGSAAWIVNGRELRTTNSEDHMRVNRIVANLRVADVDAAKSFYTDYLGLSTEGFNMGWVARYISPETGAYIQLVTRDATSPEDSVVSVLTDDVDSAYAEAQELGFEIVRPLTKEDWGVRRFLVRAPDGNVVNIVDHRA